MKFERVLAVQNAIVPELSELILKRYNILRAVKNSQPIGRRSLSSELGFTERVLRAEVDRLRELGLVNIEASGMRLSQLGEKIILETEELIYNIKGLKDIEEKIKEKLGIINVSIVEGSFLESEIVKRDLGRKTSIIIQKYLEDNMKIGIMGGTTMAVVANEMEEVRNKNGILVVPGRGGLGEKLEIQSNSVAAKLANKIGAGYKLLHVPDNINSEVLEALKLNPQVKSVLDEIKNIDMLIFAIGTAVDMAERRGLSDLKKDELKLKNASAEALGYYFDKNGNPIMHSDSVGIDLNDLSRIKYAVCASAGKSKAEAINAFSKYYKNYTLVTDEETAKEILKLN
jgi:central glycolytic genes regulator